MADFKAFSPSSWKAFTKKCSELFPFLKKQYNMTQAEWDALSSVEKIAMAGQNVVITDDEGTQTFDEIIPSDASASNKLVTESDLDAGPTYFTETFAGADDAGTVTKTWTCTKAGTYFILVCGNPFSSNSSMEVIVSKGTTIIRSQSNNNADADNYANLSVFVPVSLALNDVVSVACLGFANVDVYNSWAIWRVGN